MNHWAKLMAAAREHQQVVSITQAQACGLDPATLWRRASSEGWERLFPGVFALPGSAATHERQVAAALLAIGGKVAACGHTAAYLWGMTERAPDCVHVVIPPYRRAPAFDEIRALRSKTVRQSDLWRVRELKVTSPARTICDLAGVIRTDHDLRALVLQACQRQLLDLGDLRQRHAQLMRSPGAARLARILRQLDTEQPNSIFEHEVRAFVRSRGLTPHPTPLWIPCRDGRARQIDVPFIDERVGVESDSGTHYDQEQIDEDDETDLELSAVGWRITRVTWRRFQRDREQWLQGLLRLLSIPPPPAPPR